MSNDLEMRRRKTQEMIRGAREFRVFEDVPELRAASDGTLELRGHASVFGNWYEIGDPSRGGFRERIAPGAFRRTLNETPDVSLLLGHGAAGSGLPLARTTAGNLQLSEDSRGLAVIASPLDPDDPDVQLLAAKMRSKLVSGMSFAFICNDDSWSQDRSERTVKTASLHKGDVSVVVHGANHEAHAEMMIAREAAAVLARRPTISYKRKAQQQRERLARLRAQPTRGVGLEAMQRVDGWLASRGTAPVLPRAGKYASRSRASQEARLAALRRP